MKSIRILSFGILVTLLSFSGLQAFGHSPCQSEQKAVNKAERESRTADRILKNLKLKEIDLHVQASENPNDAATYGHELSEIAKKIKKAEKVAKEKREKLNSARNVRDYCIGTAYRTCGCATHHTESITSCSCDYNTWNSWCQCPGSS